MNERPLVAFTLLTQLGVGAFLVVLAIELGAGGLVSEASVAMLTNQALLVVVPVVIAGLLSSMLHLGAPRNAWRSLANVRGSWLSREVLLALVFAGLTCVFAVLRWTGAGSPPVRTIAGFVAGAAGIALVYAMARVYGLRTVPAWNTPLTTVSFFATTMLLGSLVVGTLVAVLPGVPEALAAAPLHRAALVAAACFAIEIAVEERGTPHDVRRMLLLAGLALAGVQVISAGRAALALVLSLGVAAVTQALGRHRFYVAGLRRVL